LSSQLLYQIKIRFFILFLPFLPERKKYPASYLVYNKN
jgi:hypothetical protein